MDNHAVPRQITTFEFKLLGFFTIKQGIYILIFAGLTLIVFFLIPVPILNFLCAGLVAFVGALVVFYRYNDRPTDVWLKNIVISLLKPSQFYFHKNNEAPEFLKGVRILNDAQAQTHIDASQKLHTYMTQTGQTQPNSQEKQNITTLIQTTPAGQQTQEVVQKTAVATPNATPLITDQTPTPTSSVPETASHQPFLSGVIKNSKGDLLPNIMIYVNSEAGQLVRILKTNHNGVFATFHPLPGGNYSLGPKDLGGTFFFDTINVTINGPIKEPVQILSKELL